MLNRDTITRITYKSKWLCVLTSVLIRSETHIVCSFFFWIYKSIIISFKVVTDGMLQDGNGEMAAWELWIAGGGCWWGSMLGSSRQLLSRGFSLPACHTGEAASARRSPGASSKKETNNWINGGSSEWLDKHTDPLWLGRVSEALVGGRRLQARARLGFLRVQLEELERSMDSDSCQNSLRYTSHTCWLTYTATRRPLMLLSP